MTKKYLVEIHLTPHTIEIEADDEIEAESIVMHNYNHGDYSDVNSVTVEEIDDEI